MPATSTRTSKPNAEQEALFRSYIAPLRVSAAGESSYPLICSLWFEYADGALYCATQKNAKIARVLSANAHCAFELSPNEPPYYGVRGQGRASLSTDKADELLQRLLLRYLGNTDSTLAQTLLKQAGDEVVIRIVPERLYSWDYRQRMQSAEE